MRIFLIPLSMTFSNPKIVGVLFCKKNGLTWAVKWEKSKLQKIVGNLLDKRQKVLHEWNDHLEISSRPQVIENCRQYLLLRTDILQKTLAGSPWINSVFCDSAKCGSQIVDFIQASLFRPGFELSQSVDFKKRVTFCDDSTCVLPINQRKSQTPFQKN